MLDDPLDFAAAYKQLEAEHEILLSFLYLSPAGIIQTNADGDILLINPHAAQLLMPISRRAKIGNFFAAIEGYAPDLRNLAESFLQPRGDICRGRRFVVSVNGPGAHILSCSLLKVNADCLMVVLQDVTREVEQEKQLKQNEALFAALVAGVNDFALFSLDAGGRIETWNVSGSRQTGFASEEVIGAEMTILYHSEDARHECAADQITRADREGWSLREASCVRRDGTRYWCQILIAAVADATGSVESYSVVMRDVTERRMTYEELRLLLTTDHLTGASNRARFFEMAEVELGRRKRTGRPLSVIMLDVDHFKAVNDRFGHSTGDLLLRELVRRCRACLREIDTLGRVGGEEFALLLPDTDLGGALALAERMRFAIETEMANLQGLPLKATISLGCAEMVDRYGGIDGLLHAADSALYAAKRAGRNRAEGPEQLHEPESASS